MVEPDWLVYTVNLGCLGDNPISFLVKSVMRLITIIHYVRRGEIQFEPTFA